MWISICENCQQLKQKEVNLQVGKSLLDLLHKWSQETQEKMHFLPAFFPFYNLNDSEW